MKLITYGLLLLVLVAPLSAQHWLLPRTLILNAVTGIGNEEGSVRIPQICLQGEYAYSREISLGFSVGYGSSRAIDAIGPIELETEYVAIPLSLKGSYHLLTDGTMDVYTTAELGYRLVTSTSTIPFYSLAVRDPNAHGSSLAYGGYGGVRFFLSGRTGLLIEAGFGSGIVRAGLTTFL